MTTFAIACGVMTLATSTAAICACLKEIRDVLRDIKRTLDHA